MADAGWVLVDLAQTENIDFKSTLNHFNSALETAPMRQLSFLSLGVHGQQHHLNALKLGGVIKSGNVSGRIGIQGRHRKR